jgi:hypothetical protein
VLFFFVGNVEDARKCTKKDGCLTVTSSETQHTKPLMSELNVAIIDKNSDGFRERFIAMEEARVHHCDTQ